MAKILIVEDEAQIKEMVRCALIFEQHTVETAAGGDEAEKLVLANSYDLLILDWNLPGRTGIDICKRFRELGGETPILMLTAKSDISSKKEGFDAGADDYLTKPFEMPELIGRVRAILRRMGPRNSDILTIGDLSIDQKKRRAMKGGETLILLPKEFSLLEFLMRNPNHVFSAEALLSHVWPSDSDASPKAVITTMKRLRQKVDPDGTLIRNQHGVGFILEGPEK